MKVKITYINYNGVALAKIVKICSWYEVSNAISNLGVSDYQVMKVERVIEADSIDIIDTTNENI